MKWSNTGHGIRRRTQTLQHGDWRIRVWPSGVPRPLYNTRCQRLSSVREMRLCRDIGCSATQQLQQDGHLRPLAIPSWRINKCARRAVNVWTCNRRPCDHALGGACTCDHEVHDGESGVKGKGYVHTNEPPNLSRMLSCFEARSAAISTGFPKRCEAA